MHKLTRYALVALVATSCAAAHADGPKPSARPPGTSVVRQRTTSADLVSTAADAAAARLKTADAAAARLKTAERQTRSAKAALRKARAAERAAKAQTAARRAVARAEAAQRRLRQTEEYQTCVDETVGRFDEDEAQDICDGSVLDTATAPRK